ncbi:hypothetical protein HanPI659440_Chr06g0228431 [Helianthus annuus]|nr:hypothetical protein HanPI659440_Chr06g0228431 [Helianthus annuus]
MAQGHFRRHKGTSGRRKRQIRVLQALLDRLTRRRQRVHKYAYVAPITGQRHLPHDLHLPADGRGTTRPTTVTRGSTHGAPAPENF